MRIVFALGIILSLLNILMADTELQFSSAKEVILFMVLWECKKQLNYLLFQGKDSHYNLEKFNYSAYDVLFERWSKGFF